MHSAGLRLHLLTLGLVAAASGVVQAQATGTVRGKIVEVGSGRPLANVQVAVVGTQRGALTSVNGDYVVTMVPAGRQTIRTRMIAYAPQDLAVDVTAQGSVTADFTLAQAAITLDEVV